MHYNSEYSKLLTCWCFINHPHRNPYPLNCRK